MLDLIKGINSKILLGIGSAAVIAVMAAFWMWSQEPKYRVVFSNFSDKDGGAIVAVLEQMNVPYKVADGGGAIMIPSDQVHQARLKLASMGLPKGGNVGFELLENQKFGVSQFVEQVNFQRALEGEIEKSIQAISVVENARVHLAIPKSTVFVRDMQKATASVLIKLQPGRSMDPRQVSAVVHLVSSSVPNLDISNVNVVDQNGNLLSDPSKKGDAEMLDPSRLKYIEEMQKGIVARVEAIIAPIVGEKNVHAEANAEIDFSRSEQADEIFKPNQNPETAVIRSLQKNESIVSGAGSAGSGAASGVPGALSNQPPANATAPLSTDPKATASAEAAGNSQKHTTTNFEVDKTVRFSQKSMGGIKRLSVAVVVNHKDEVDKDGKVTSRPLNEDEKKQINELAKQAMGYSEERGDSLSVVNSRFSPVKTEEVPDLPIWKNPAYIEMAKDAAKLLLGIAAMFLLYKKALSPMITKLLTHEPKARTLTQSLGSANDDPSNYQAGSAQLSGQGYQQDLQNAKLLAKDNPKMVANVVTSWVSGNG
ncbi:flagellar M-ring protein FliF [Polynucleobacter aenigmaticus]|uniref:Flagellar M-ring protein n=1 Tax=Polynucleobacter aenigmaticus TaxID=1743164 RepID=A0A254Q4S7_9BURK|nr:flagellar basal-body MS-ring/collar protein FliF [Polynucleobacter aenigmaticus]OWS71841.1 flagellar M-ring protein FliF [Polynucleobacter aenigmaticus]